MISFRTFAAVIAVAVAGVLAVPSLAAAAKVSDSPREVFDYWTDERMKDALSADRLLGDVTSGAPLSHLGLGIDKASGSGEAEKVARPGRKPLRTHGKVFFRDGLFNYVCSGTVVRSRTKSLVVSAGHCVHSQNGYADKWMFVPAKDGKREPFGRWAAKRLATTPQWRRSEDIKYDVGMATMARRSGMAIQQRVGARGIEFNRRGSQFRAFGYPAEGRRFDGRTPYSCRSDREGTDESQGKPEPNRIACDMTGGSSGGGWVLPSGDVNSVVSYGYECILPLPNNICKNPERGKLFGPYFGDQIQRLYRRVAR